LRDSIEFAENEDAEMLEIQSIQDKTEQENICNMCGAVYDADALAYKCLESAEGVGVIAGCVQFRITGRRSGILTLSNAAGCDNSDALFLLGRSALNFINLCGVDDSYINENCGCADNIIFRIGFRKNSSGELYMNLKDFFAEPCAHDAGTNE